MRLAPDWTPQGSQVSSLTGSRPGAGALCPSFRGGYTAPGGLLALGGAGELRSGPGGGLDTKYASLPLGHEPAEAATPDMCTRPSPSPKQTRKRLVSRWGAWLSLVVSQGTQARLVASSNPGRAQPQAPSGRHPPADVDGQGPRRLQKVALGGISGFPFIKQSEAINQKSIYKDSERQ